MDKILVVEDDKTVYSGIKKLLELQHYSVVIAQNGMEALEKIDESFSLVIMDIMMPQLDGIETCRRMRESLIPYHLVYHLNCIYPVQIFHQQF